MPPKKTKRGTKKEKKVEATPEENLEVEEKVGVDETELGVKLEEESEEKGLEVDVEGQMDPFGQPTDSEAQKSEEELPNDDNEAYMDVVNVDLSIEEDPGVLQQQEQQFEEEEQTDDLLLEMGDLLNALVQLSSELEEKEEDEEEGAIREDEVPFERLPELNPESSVLLLVNLPPELDSSRVLSLFKDSKLVTSVTLISKTQVKVFFRSQRIAAEAKSRLDNIKLYNRRLQALYARDIFANNYVPPPAYPPMAQPPGNYNRMPNNFQNRNNFFPHVPPPPNKTYTRLPQDKGKLIFNKYKLLNVTLQQLLLEFYNKMNLVPGTGKSKWDETKSFFENQVAFDRVYQKLGITTRYILIGNLKEDIMENSESVYDFLSRFTNNSYTYQIVKLPYNYASRPDSESLEDRKWLHVVFEKNRDGSGFFNKLNHLINYKREQGNMEAEDPDNVKDLVLKYSCPLSATESLWISNVHEFCGYFKSEDDVYGFFNSLGVVKNFKLVYDAGCIFVTFQNKDITTRIYNFLNTLSPKRVIKVSSYTNSRNNPGAPERVDLEAELYPLEKDTDVLNVDFSGKTENSFVLGQKLLNAIKRRADSQEVIDRLLKSNDISNFMSEPQSKRQRTVRPEPQDFRRRDTPRFERRPYRDNFGRDTYGRSEYNREAYPRDNYGRDSHSRDHYAREPYPRDSYRDSYREGRDSRDNRDSRDLREGYGRDRDREFNRFRQRYPINKERVDRFGRTIRNYDRMRRDEPWKGPKGHPNDSVHPYRDPGARDSYLEQPGAKLGGQKGVGPGPEVDAPIDAEPFKPRSPERPPPESPAEGGKREMIYSKLLKRGKYICRVSCAFVRGDYDSKLPEMLDVNQRANPERLKNCLAKSSELSLWQLGADSKDDSDKYDSLCDYLISKNRVALVQQGPYDVYIVPPNDSYVEMLQTPDANFMYAYLLPRSP